MILTEVVITPAGGNHYLQPQGLQKGHCLLIFDTDTLTKNCQGVI